MPLHSSPITVGLAIFLLASVSAVAQPVSDETVDAIVGSPVAEHQANAKADESRILAAIDKSAENAGLVRKTSKADKLDIVFMADAAAIEGGPPAAIEARIEMRADEIRTLRQEIEGNAMIFHAIESRQILPGDVLAVEFDGTERITIYAAAKPVQ